MCPLFAWLYPVDDVRLHNPLERSERMSTGWFGVICEVSSFDSSRRAAEHVLPVLP